MGSYCTCGICTFQTFLSMSSNADYKSLLDLQETTASGDFCVNFSSSHDPWLEFQFRNKIDWARFRNRSIRFEAKINCGFHAGHNLRSSGSKCAACLTHLITQPSLAVHFLIHQCTLVFAVALKMAHGKKQNGF